MACGLPVVITDFGDNRKWVEDGVNGFLMPLRDSEAMASKILDLLSHKEKRIKFGQSNRRIIEEGMNMEKEMRRMEMFYEQLKRRSGK
jgi:glycosyltransferase involved in cell wall biosynthesis